jgi:hypothetical protein
MFAFNKVVKGKVQYRKVYLSVYARVLHTLSTIYVCMSTEFFRGGGVGKARDASLSNFLHLPPGKNKEKVR